MFFDFCIGKVHTLSAVNYLVNLRRSIYDLVTIICIWNGVPLGYDNVVYYVVVYNCKCCLLNIMMVPNEAINFLNLNVVHNTIVMFAVCPR